jgi:hypothetical protein
MVIAAKHRIAGVVGFATLVAGLSVAACNIVLGIGDARYDPSIDDAGSDAGLSLDSGGGGPTADCTTYCTLLAKNCTGSNLEYIDDATCKAICTTFDPGKPGDNTGDSLTCRIFHAQAAALDPSFNCQQAGPLAGGGCADPCSAFCLRDDILCAGITPPPYEGGVPECKAACAKYTYLSGDLLFPSGDTLNCRLYELELAYDPANPNVIEAHCPHTAAVSATCN